MMQERTIRRLEIVAPVIAVIAIIATFFVPEVRRWLGLEKPSSSDSDQVGSKSQNDNSKSTATGEKTKSETSTTHTDTKGKDSDASGTTVTVDHSGDHQQPSNPLPPKKPSTTPRSDPEPPRTFQLVGTWFCKDRNGNVLKTVTFNSDGTYTEQRGNTTTPGNYVYDERSEELQFVFIHTERGNRTDIMEAGRVTKINASNFKFTVLRGIDKNKLILPVGETYEFQR
jgi:cytoskeletal protein RodZ